MRPEKKNWKRKLAWKAGILCVVALLILVAVLALAPKDSVWEETKRELEGRGEELDWEEFIPAKVAREENLFGDPVAASLLPLKGQPRPANPLEADDPQMPPGAEGLGIPFEMARLKEIPREETIAEDRLSLAELDEWFGEWDESFAQLREAGKRRKAQIPGDYNSPFDAPMLNFVGIRTLAHVLVSRAKVHLVMGESAAALEDLETLSVVMRALEAQPGTLVSGMIHVAVGGIYIETVEAGLREKLWREEELKQLSERLLRMNMLGVVQQGLRAERAAVLRHLEALANRKQDPLYERSIDLLTGASDSWTVEGVLSRVAPVSWIRRNQADYARILQGYIDSIESEGRVIDMEKISVVNAELSRLNTKWSPKMMLMLIATPNFSRAAQTVGSNQARAHQAAIACAIERFRLRHERVPTELAELVPGFLESIPNGVFSGEMMSYRKTDKGWGLSAGAEFASGTNATTQAIQWNIN